MTYVISDLHGLDLRTFQQMLNSAGFCEEDDLTYELERYIFDGEICNVPGESYVRIKYGKWSMDLTIEIEETDSTV